MVQAGAKPICWLAVTSEWVPDYKSPERAKVGGVWSRRGGAVGLLGDYVLAQVTAGIVPMPSWAAPGQAPTGEQTDADAINRLAEEMLRLRDQGFAKVNTSLRAGRGDCHARPPGGKDARALTGDQGRYCGSQPKDHCLAREDRSLRLG
jgi:hypothetical protein